MEQIPLGYDAPIPEKQPERKEGPKEGTIRPVPERPVQQIDLDFDKPDVSTLPAIRLLPKERIVALRNDIPDSLLSPTLTFLIGQDIIEQSWTPDVLRSKIPDYETIRAELMLKNRDDHYDELYKQHGRTRRKK